MDTIQKGILTLAVIATLFIAFKLGAIITWSWWIVLIPAYPFLSLLAFMLFILIITPKRGPA
jgi:hypothetical protein